MRQVHVHDIDLHIAETVQKACSKNILGLWDALGL